MSHMPHYYGSRPPTDILSPMGSLTSRRHYSGPAPVLPQSRQQQQLGIALVDTYGNWLPLTPEIVRETYVRDIMRGERDDLPTAGEPDDGWGESNTLATVVREENLRRVGITRAVEERREKRYNIHSLHFGGKSPEKVYQQPGQPSLRYLSVEAYPQFFGLSEEGIASAASIIDGMVAQRELSWPATQELREIA